MDVEFPLRSDDPLLPYMKTARRTSWKYLGPRYSFIGFDESTLHQQKSRCATFWAG